MDATKELEKELSDVLDKFERGEADHLDVTIALLNLCGLANKELATRALTVLEKTLVKKPMGRPPVADMQKINELKSLGYTQEKIARELNISLSTVRRALKHNFLQTQPVMKMECTRTQVWGEGAGELPKAGNMAWCVWCQKMEKIEKILG